MNPPSTFECRRRRRGDPRAECRAAPRRLARARPRRGARRTPRPARPPRPARSTSAGSPSTTTALGHAACGRGPEVGAVVAEEPLQRGDQIEGAAQEEPVDLERRPHRARVARPSARPAGTTQPTVRAADGAIGARRRRVQIRDPITRGREPRGADDRRAVDRLRRRGPGGSSPSWNPRDVIAENRGGVALAAPPPTAPGSARPRRGARRSAAPRRTAPTRRPGASARAGRARSCADVANVGGQRVEQLLHLRRRARSGMTRMRPFAWTTTRS